MLTLGLTFCFYIETPAKLDFLLFRHFERSENEVSAPPCVLEAQTCDQYQDDILINNRISLFSMC